MVPDTKPAARRGQALVLCLVLGVGSLGCSSTSLHAQENRDGMVISVPSPIRDTVVEQIELKIRDAVVRQRRPISMVVFDFNPDGAPAATPDPNSPTRLAQFIRSLQQGRIHGKNIATRAFVHNKVTKHTVLPVLACKNIIMSDEPDPSAPGETKARLGDVTPEAGDFLRDTTRLAYAEVGKSFPSPDLIARLLDPGLVITRVKTAEGPRYLSAKSLQERDKATYSVDEKQPEALRPGKVALWNAKEAMELGLCSDLRTSLVEVIASLDLPKKSLSEDWTLGKEARAWRIDVRSSLDKGKLEALERRFQTAVGRGANLIIFHLDAEGGETKDVASVARKIRGLRAEDGLPVKTIAYVPPGRALGSATFLAVACNEIVMAQDAVLADFNYLPADQVEDVKAMLVPLAREQGFPPLLFEAALSKDLMLYRMKTDKGEDRLVAEKDLANHPTWKNVGGVIRTPGQLLKITARLADEFGIAQATDISTLDQLAAAYAPGAQVRIARDDWLEQVAEFFRAPAVNFFLIMVGIVGLILEMKLPGTTVPGVIAAICFVLFFWAYSFVGQFTLLAVLLFVLGLILIGVEIFVLPGFGFTGISGILLVISSLVLVTLDKMPQTSQDWLNLGTTFGTFGLSLVAALVAAFVVAWYLPSIPYANRLVLQPPDENGAEDEGQAAAGTLNSALLGAIGVAATPLRPAGKAQIGDDFLDVVAEGDYVQPGSRIQVIEIEGNRIVVKEI